MTAACMAVRADDGCALHVESEGEGPPLLLISGLGGVASFWDAVRPMLRQHFRLVLFDHRGTGRSERSPDGHSIGRLAADAVAILDALGIDGAHLIGHSTGGTVAQTLALDVPARVRRLVISGSWARADYRFRLLFETRLRVLQQAGPETYAALGQLLGLPADWINAHEDGVRHAILNAGTELKAPQAAQARLRMLLDYDRLDNLHRIAAPILVLGASDDMIVPYSHSVMIADRIPGAGLVDIPGGHFFPRTQAKAFVEAVAGFLR